MADGRAKRPPGEALVDLRRRLAVLPARDPLRQQAVAEAAAFFGISTATLYRCLREQLRPKSVRRTDHGQPRVASLGEMERYAEIVAALKLRTTNKQGRKVSTARAIELLETHGVETPQGLIMAPKGLLARATMDRFMRQAGYDHRRIIPPRAAVHFQARRSNELWQFDMSPSDLKQVKAPLWIEEGRGKPTLMLFSVVDDRSGVDYEEYRCVYGEDAESALRFLFNAMAPKPEPEMPFQRIPEAIYMDNGPVARAKVFQSVMGLLGVRILTHQRPPQDPRRTPARSKGKVERAFRTVKEAHETLYHFHEPKDEAEANLWLRRFLVTYNNQKHRSEPHSRIEDWLKNLPAAGVRAMCSWERFCAFAREPEKRLVGGDARVSVDGTEYEVDPDLADETVILWWGLFDQELFVEHAGKRYGPYSPSRGAIPLYRYRKYQKTKSEERIDRVMALAQQLGLPRAAVTGEADALSAPLQRPVAVPRQPFPEPSDDPAFPSVIAARSAIADLLRMPLAKLPEADLAFVNALISNTLDRRAILRKVCERFGLPVRES
ncbi:MAG TPA: IS481 family transposase [Stellaceae bacterium]|nr:IS481 family transposase [Stellaceae bacterium]